MTIPLEETTEVASKFMESALSVIAPPEMVPAVRSIPVLLASIPPMKEERTAVMTILRAAATFKPAVPVKEVALATVTTDAPASSKVMEKLD